MADPQAAANAGDSVGAARSRGGCERGEAQGEGGATGHAPRGSGKESRRDAAHWLRDADTDPKKLVLQRARVGRDERRHG